MDEYQIVVACMAPALTACVGALSNGEGPAVLHVRAVHFALLERLHAATVVIGCALGIGAGSLTLRVAFAFACGWAVAAASTITATTASSSAATVAPFGARAFVR